MSKKPLTQLTLLVLVLAILSIWLIPFFWMLLNSFKGTQDIIQPKLTLFFKPTFEHYRYIFERQAFFLYARNSVLVATLTTAITIVVGTLAAYSISRFNTGGQGLGLWILVTRMAPPAVLIVPFFLMFRKLGLTNTIWALVIADTTFNLPFVIWTMRGFLDEIPEALEEAAMIDGCTRVQALKRVIIPSALPGLIVTTIFCMIFTWNEYLFALTLATAKASKTLPVAAGDFITGYAINWGPVFASGTLILLPIFVTVIFLQKYIVRGLTMGAIK